MHAPGRSSRHPESGAITIMVVLMLLVLLTLSAVGMSRNSLRAIIASGTVSQGSQAQNVADAGLEWAVFWLAADPNSPPLRPAATGGALALQGVRDSIISGASIGLPTAVPASSDFTLPGTGHARSSFDLTLTLMGQLPAPNTSPQPGKSTTDFTPASINLWAIGTNGSLAYGGGPSFTRRREVWVTVPPS
jgi:hypothetical protein